MPEGYATKTPQPALPANMMARYQTRAIRHVGMHPALPLAWGTVLIAVPLFWLTAIAWFTRMVF
ncbi:hypothetical protein ACN2XU_14590 [Primorskyibacter sp. 2E107]|uniref:hypothetical protein n=1 Tax=Primorskyibacter sp. 2E107 TaxID=3403458 RepID=UPI003AF86550